MGDELAEGHELGLGELVGRTIDDGRALVGAEIALLKARAAERLASYRGAATFFAIGGVLAFSGFIALLIGLIMSLATVIGPGFATAAVVGAVFLVAGVLCLIGKRQLAPPDLEKAR